MNTESKPWTREVGRYVVGFIFNTEEEWLILIRKNRPERQKGLLNGIGGKVEKGETPVEAMVREAKEEAGLDSTPGQWLPFHRSTKESGNDLFFFAIDLKGIVTRSGISTHLRSQTDEKLEAWKYFTYGEKASLMCLPFSSHQAMYNLCYLVPMAHVYLIQPEHRCYLDWSTHHVDTDMAVSERSRPEDNKVLHRAPESFGGRRMRKFRIWRWLVRQGLVG